jgi:hypothetical protein
LLSEFDQTEDCQGHQYNKNIAEARFHMMMLALVVACMGMRVPQRKIVMTLEDPAVNSLVR